MIRLLPSIPKQGLRKQKYLRKKPGKKQLICRISNLAGLSINARDREAVQFSRSQLMELESFLRRAHEITTIFTRGGYLDSEVTGSSRKTSR